MSRILLHLRGIGLTFGGRPILENAELAVAEGERVALVGRNGSGKSTLLKIAAGMIEADKGERWVQPGTADLARSESSAPHPAATTRTWIGLPM